MVENKESFSSSAAGKVSPACLVTRSLKGKNIIISLRGEIDLDSASNVYKQIRTEIDSSEQGLLLDLEELDFMDSSGLQILLRLKERLNKIGKEVLIVNPSTQIMKLFQLTGFDKLFNIFTDTDEALSYLRNQGST